MTTFEGKFIGKDVKIAIVVARFNEFITSKLLGGAMDGLIRNEVAKESIDVYWVPGAFEIPFALEKALESGKYDAICCVGAVIRGATPHFDYISAEATKGIATVGIKHGKPVANGVLTTDTIEQAIERAGSKVGNKGAEAMVTIIEMLDLYNEMGK